jgi:hypothetical protein
MGVRTRGLDIKAGAAKLKADKAARMEAERQSRAGVVRLADKETVKTGSPNRGEVMLQFLVVDLGSGVPPLVDAGSLCLGDAFQLNSANTPSMSRKHLPAAVRCRSALLCGP